MLNFLIAVATMAVVLGIMIVIHELGHHIVAKLCGVRVEVFSVGFGKRLLGFTRGGTDYRISALPFGGYVKMAGENPMEQRTGAPDEFMSHPRWQRVLIAIAGPAMNILLAVGLLTCVFMVRYEHPAFMDRPAEVGYVEPDSAAAKAGVQPGDRIIRFDNLQNPVWEDVFYKALLSPHQPMSMAVQRGSQTLSLRITPQQSKDPQEVGVTGLLPQQPNIITSIEQSMPAYKAGLRVGDEITALNGVRMLSMPAIHDFLKKNGEKPVQVTALRAGQEIQLSLTPVLQEYDGDKYYRMGFISQPTHVDKLPFGQALHRSVEENKKFSFLIVELLQKMVERKVSMRQVDGPIGIGKAAGEAVRKPGWTPLLGLMSAISLNLGVFNLLPIPILDGGLILLTLIESVIRRDINQRLKERIYQTAFVFLVIFAAVVVYNDVTKLSLFSKYLP